MRPTDNIHSLIKKLHLKAGAELDQRLRAEIRRALDEQRQTKPAATRPKTWRIIMKSRITKLAAAAVIIAGVVLSITLLDGSLSPAFGIDDVWAATAKAEWVHSTWQYTETEIEPNNIEQQIVESWMSINPRRHIFIFRNGFIHFSEYDDVGGEVKSQMYNSQTNVLAINYVSTDKPINTPTTLALTFYADMLRMQSEGAATVKYTDAVYDGRRAMIIDLTDLPKSFPYRRYSMLADAETRLPKRLVLYPNDSLGKRQTATLMFDYPSQGPTDIYQVGAPRDAIVEIIDRRPSAEFLEAIRPYRAARENLPDQRIVVDVTNENDTRYRVCVIYTNGRKERFEHLMWVKNNSPPTKDDFNEILEWADTADSGELGIQLYDGVYMHHIERDYRNRWTGHKSYSPDYKPDYVIGGLVHRGWPKIRRGKFVTNAYATDNNLLCIEEHDKKTLYYIDPAHDYMCVRTENFHDLPTSLDNSTHSEPYRVSTVKEFGQTDSGHWYPSEITTNQLAWWDDYPGNAKTLEEKFVIRLYVETPSLFPDDIFNPQSLPDINE